MRGALQQLGRTGTLIVWLSLVGLFALVFLAGKPGGEAMLNSILFFFATLGGAQATKSAVEATKTGVGLKSSPPQQ